jgi:HEAT repeat protein
MDELERLVDAYQVRGSATVRSKLSVLMHLKRIRDPRVVPFLLKVLEDAGEVEQVRIYVLKQLRNGDGLLVPADRGPVAKAIADVLDHGATAERRLEAALALGEFTQVDGVLARLGAVCLTHDESIDLRYAAFTSLERARPMPDYIALLRADVNRRDTRPLCPKRPRSVACRIAPLHWPRKGPCVFVCYW